MNRRRPCGEMMSSDHVACVFIIDAIPDDELHFVVRAQAIEVAPIHLLRLAAAGALHIENRYDLLGDACGAAMAAGFEQHRAAAIDQRLHERIDVLLQQRLAAGDLDERAVEAVDLLEHLIDRVLAALVKRVRRVAPRAAQVAGGEAHEDTRTPGVAGLALHRIEDLVNREQSFYYPVKEWATFASAPRVGIIRRAKVRGTACSTRRAGRSVREPISSTSSGSMPNTSIRSR